MAAGSGWWKNFAFNRISDLLFQVGLGFVVIVAGNQY
jgi:hypothetical protein